MRKPLVLGIIISLLLFNLISVDWVKGDTVTVTFSGITNPSSTHKAYYRNTENNNWGFSGTEFTSGMYSQTIALDANSAYTTSTVNNQLHRFEFNVSKVMSDNGISIGEISQVVIRADGYGAITGGPYGYISAILNQGTSTWITSNSTGVTGTWSHTTNGVSAVSITIAEANVSGMLWDGTDYILKYAVEADMDTGDEKLYTDRVLLTITYTPSLTAPTLVSPTNGGTGYTITPNFDWDASTGGTSPYTYELMVDSDLAFGSPDINATGIADSNYSYTTGLTPATVYYWKVRALDAGSAYSDWTSVRSFTTAPFTAPAITSPSNGGTGSASQTFSWSASTGGDGNYTYELQVSLNSGFAGTVVDATGITSTSYSASGLTADTFYARVRGKDGLGNYTDWSSTVAFTVLASGGASGGATTSTQETIYAPIVEQPVAPVVVAQPSTNIFTKYVVQPMQTIVINPMQNFFVWVWTSFKALIYGSNQEQFELPVVGYADTKLIWAIGVGCVVLLWLFGSPVKKKDVRKMNKSIGKNIRRIKRGI